MASRLVRADYDGLLHIARSLGAQAGLIQAVDRALRARLDALKNGQWVGVGATGFFREMDGSVLPAVSRLAVALDGAQRVTLRIRALMNQAELDAAAVFLEAPAGNNQPAPGAGQASPDLLQEEAGRASVDSPNPAAGGVAGAKYVKVNAPLFSSGPRQTTTNGGISLPRPRPIMPGDVRQGNTGDCHMLASLAAIAVQHPEAIEKMIRQNKDGTYDVTIYDREGANPKVIRVTGDLPLQDGQAAFAGVEDPGTGHKELWPALIEKAWAVEVGGGRYAGISGAALGQDGNPSVSLARLTGRPVQSIEAGNASFNDLKQMVDRGDAVVLSTFDGHDYANLIGNPLYMKDVLVENHAYYVIDVIPDGKGSGKVVLGNPWGWESTNPQGQSDGVITLSMQDVQKSFEFVDASHP